MLAKVGGKPKMEIPMYEGSLNAEELIYWMRSIDQYFDYEEIEEKKIDEVHSHQIEGSCSHLVG